VKKNPYIDDLNDKTPEIAPAGNLSLMINKVMSFGITRNEPQ
jgi:hypothetical protein